MNLSLVLVLWAAHHSKHYLDANECNWSLLCIECSKVVNLQTEIIFVNNDGLKGTVVFYV